VASTFTIGKLAAAAGVHVETVRYYERRGLLSQPPPGPGYRQYNEDHLWRLQFIALGKRLGFTLAEIASVMGPADRPSSPSRVAAAARAKIAAVDAELQALARTRCRLQQLAELCEHGDEADCVALRVAG
jgi:MerR family mercuric resistance operon transcriptional regulator